MAARFPSYRDYGGFEDDYDSMDAYEFHRDRRSRRGRATRRGRSAVAERQTIAARSVRNTLVSFDPHTRDMLRESIYWKPKTKESTEVCGTAPNGIPIYQFKPILKLDAHPDEVTSSSPQQSLNRRRGKKSHRRIARNRKTGNQEMKKARSTSITVSSEEMPLRNENKPNLEAPKVIVTRPLSETSPSVHDDEFKPIRKKSVGEPLVLVKSRSASQPRLNSPRNQVDAGSPVHRSLSPLPSPRTRTSITHPPPSTPMRIMETPRSPPLSQNPIENSSQPVWQMNAPTSLKRVSVSPDLTRVPATGHKRVMTQQAQTRAITPLSHAPVRSGLGIDLYANKDIQVVGPPVTPTTLQQGASRVSPPPTMTPMTARPSSSMTITSPRPSVDVSVALSTPPYLAMGSRSGPLMTSRNGPVSGYLGSPQPHAVPGTVRSIPVVPLSKDHLNTADYMLQAPGSSSLFQGKQPTVLLSSPSPPTQRTELSSPNTSLIRALPPLTTNLMQESRSNPISQKMHHKTPTPPRVPTQHQPPIRHIQAAIGEQSREREKGTTSSPVAASLASGPRVLDIGTPLTAREDITHSMSHSRNLLPESTYLPRNSRPSSRRWACCARPDTASVMSDVLSEAGLPVNSQLTPPAFDIPDSCFDDSPDMDSEETVLSSMTLASRWVPYSSHIHGNVDQQQQPKPPAVARTYTSTPHTATQHQGSHFRPLSQPRVSQEFLNGLHHLGNLPDTSTWYGFEAA